MLFRLSTCILGTRRLSLPASILFTYFGKPQKLISECFMGEGSCQLSPEISFFFALEKSVH